MFNFKPKHLWLICALILFGLLTLTYTCTHINNKGTTRFHISEKLYDELKLIYYEKDAIIKREIKVLKSEKSLNDSLIEIERKKLSDRLLVQLISKIKYGVEDTLYKKLLARHNEKTTPECLMDMLPLVEVNQNSWFWFYDDKRYLEVLYWALIGVICGLLFNVTQSLKTKDFDKKLIPDHLARLIYGPVVALVIYFSFDIISVNTELINIVPENYGLIILSFILGFFSRRSMELLNKLKKFILPLKDKKDELADVKVESTEPLVDISNDYLKLDTTKQHDLIREWQINNSAEFIEEYNLSGISAGFKEIKGLETKVYAIIFQVIKKETSLKTLPRTIPYKNYKIPTDVVENPESVSVMSTHPLESSVSRDGMSELFGTLGIKVLDQGIEYLMSCYHVYFPTELKKDQREVKNKSNILGSSAILSPKKSNKLGEVCWGKLNEWLDIGLMKVDASKEVFDEWQSKMGPYGLRYLNFDDELNHTNVQFWGSGTGKIVSRKIKHLFSTQPIKYDKIDKSIKQTIKGLVELDGPANGGDSGGAVFDSSGRFVGMIVASSGKNAYMISLLTIVDNTKITIKTIK